MRILDAQATARALPFERLVPALQERFCEGCETPARQVLEIPDPQGAAPLIHGAWLRPGSHLDLIGSFTPAMREADDDCFVGVRWAVDTDEALGKSGDLIGPLARGLLSTTAGYATLAELLRGQKPGRQQAEERTVFKSVGHALEDLAAAMLAVEES